MKKTTHLIFLSIFSIIIFFSIFELSLRLGYDNFSNYNMEMWKYSKELKMPTDNNNLPFVHLPNKSIDLYGAQITTDSNGFRVNDNSHNISYFDDKILFLGDSFTFGWGVPNDSTFSQLIGRWLLKDNKNISTINAGCGNYNTIMEVELFKTKGLQLNPKIVVLAYYINDIEDTPQRISSITHYIMTNFYLYGYLFDKYVKIKSKYDIEFNNNYYMSHYTDSVKKNNNKNAITELANICKDNKIKLLVVNIPDLRILTNYPYKFGTNYIKQTVQDLELEFLDLYETIKLQEPETLWVDQEDPHANSHANYLFALAIFNKINEMNWFD